MDSWQSWYQSSRQQRALLRWAAQGHLDAAGLRTARAWVGDPPGAADWRRFWLALCGWLGVCLIAAAAVTFFAANWSAMGRFARLGLAEAALVLAAAVAFCAGRRWPVLASLALWLACALIGVLLALIGQVYQLGADPWQLFVLWAALMLPWTFASRQAATWLLFAAVAEIGLWLWADTHLHGTVFAVAFAAGNLLGLAAWEVARGRLAWLAGRNAGPRLIVLALLTGVSVLALPNFLVRAHGGWSWLVWLGCCGGLLLYFLRARRDLVILALVLLNVIVMVTVHLGVRVLDTTSDVVASATMLAVLVLAQAALAAKWLRSLGGNGAEP
ncbi:DUF2157 domain-containing protein [Verticiella sediminum]|uniref:DUF2157 domain-containing protein n=1 Tax=Verticiella sediminum TaxID=1247510 RepID=UPI001478B327|nr:DUF2157 domain-containing protein [Verticiella sediminum]